MQSVFLVSLMCEWFQTAGLGWDHPRMQLCFSQSKTSQTTWCCREAEALLQPEGKATSLGFREARPACLVPLGLVPGGVLLLLLLCLTEWAHGGFREVADHSVSADPLGRK